jgi:hypothetical protein
LRSGRFGIGALAAFLLGEEMSLTTRNVRSHRKDGIEFTSELDAESIELRRVECPVGTKIRIRIDKETRKILKELRVIKLPKKKKLYLRGDNWDWYCLSEPKVIRLIDHKPLAQDYILPSENSELPLGWWRISHPDYEDIHWSYLRISQARPVIGMTLPERPLLACNGIVIEQKFSTGLRPVAVPTYIPLIGMSDSIAFRTPNISVFDPDAKLPLNLQRSQLTIAKQPFHKQLQTDIANDFMSYLLVNIPEEPLYSSFAEDWYAELRYPGTRGYRSFASLPNSDLSPWFSTRSGVGLIGLRNHAYQQSTKGGVVMFSYRNQIDASAFAQRRSVFHPNDNLFLESQNTLLFYKNFIYLPENPWERQDERSFSAQEIIQALSTALLFRERIVYYSKTRVQQFKKRVDLTEAESIKENEEFYPKRILISKEAFLMLERTHDKVIYDPLLRGTFPIKYLKASQEWSNEDWVIIKIGECPDSKVDLIAFAKQHPKPNIIDWPCMLMEFYFKYEPDGKPTVLETLWHKMLGDSIIPYDLEERRQKFAHFYKQFGERIRRHELMKDLHADVKNGE